MEQENNDKEADNSADVSAKSVAVEQRDDEAAVKSLNNEGAENPGEIPIKAESSKKRTQKSLKPKSKIKKGPPPGSISLKAEKAKHNLQFRGRNPKKKNKSAFQDKRENNKNEFKNDKNQSSREDKLQTNGANEERTGANEEHTGKGLEILKNQGVIAGSSKRNQKNENKHGGQDKNLSNQKNEGKLDVKQKSQGDQKKKEKLGGLIFMCNAKTKPDCFRYHVMGVTSNKKDLVLGVKRGLKLFLYDFDLRLMYGIYEACSSGGMKLEPKAFGGSFPVQVRFRVHQDCAPLSEMIFKKAIKDNYDEKNKFDIELTVRQVRKLSALFQPVAFQSVKAAAVPVRSVPVTTIRDREVYERLRESRPLSDREPFLRVSGDGRSYPVCSHERDQHIEHREVVPRHREEVPCDLYMSEKEYRTYGLQRERRNLTPPCSAAAIVDLYPRNLEREHLLRQPALPYSDTVPVHRESVIADPLYSTQREFTYSIGGRSELLTAAPSVSVVPSSSAVASLDYNRRDPYSSYQYGTSSASAYQLPPRREEVSSGSYYIDGRRETYLNEADQLHRRETESVNKLYLKYGVEPLSDYNKQVYQGAKPETVPPPVSSRYSFAGPSLSYR